MTTHLCGAGMAFVGFSASLIIGLNAQNSYNTIVLRALCVMLVFYILGVVLALVGQKVIDENFATTMEEIQSEIESAETEIQDIEEIQDVQESPVEETPVSQV